jgi:hypothetical protein
MLIRDLDSEAEIGPRVPFDLNTGELPRARAKVLAHRVLARVRDPLYTSQFDLADPDFFIDIGSVIIAQDRTGTTPKHIVESFGINGSSGGKQGHRVNMNVSAKKLP